ncbi:MAG: hypothetical protein ABI781_17955 [Burkholderiales bacterium]
MSTTAMTRRALIALALASSSLSGCDMLGGALGIESPEKVAAAREADGKAIGGACRHAGRAIEDCYTLNKKAEKASIFAGWRDMNDYMRENKIDAVAPQLGAQPATQVAGAKVDADADSSAKPVADKPEKSTKGEAAKRGKAQDS